MQLRIANLSIAIGEDGNLTSNLSFNLNYDACSVWARIALFHRENAIQAKAAREIVWSGVDEAAKGRALEAEFQASMQAIVAAASSIDAFYATVSDRFPVDLALRAAWTKNRTARSTQIRETLRTIFGLATEGAEGLGRFLAALYKIRDAALHPSAKHQPPFFHSDLGVSTEWRFWAFRADVADSFTCMMAQVLWNFAHCATKKEIADSQFSPDFKRVILEMFPDGVPQPSHQEVSFCLP